MDKSSPRLPDLTALEWKFEELSSSNFGKDKVVCLMTLCVYKRSILHDN